jgi:hypothetical protein
MELQVSAIGERGCIIEVVIIRTAVGIAQLAEHRTVAPTVAGSIPVSHPRIFLSPSLSPPGFLIARLSILSP